jgi:hypothetical protein
MQLSVTIYVGSKGKVTEDSHRVPHTTGYLKCPTLAFGLDAHGFTHGGGLASPLRHRRNVTVARLACTLHSLQLTQVFFTRFELNLGSAQGLDLGWSTATHGQGFPALAYAFRLRTPVPYCAI